MHEYMSTVRVWELTCPGFPEDVSRARRFTRDILHGIPCADDAALIVTELGTNAITHTASAHGSWRLTIARTSGTVTLSVTDSGDTPTTPHLRHPDAAATTGRGLALVAAFAATVQVHGHTDGHTVTAELPTQRPAHPPTSTRHGPHTPC